MVGRAALRQLRRWAPFYVPRPYQPASSKTASAAVSAVARSAQLWCTSSTSYEGSGGDESQWLRQLSECQSGFSRSTFVKERACANELKAKYILGEELGSGATATVYRAVNRRTGHEVAVKVICKVHVQDPQMLQSEIQIHKATDHPNILRLLETFEDECKHYLVSELCAGGDLWRHLATCADDYSSYSALPMPEEDALHIFQQVVKSVAYLHSRGIVHRDLKPGNFLIQTPLSAQKEGRRQIIKLADFGVSACCRDKRRLTRRVGTDGFMAPEILQNQPYNEKADIFSIGCILHMLLTGHPPKPKQDGTYAVSKIRLQFVSAQGRELVHRLLQPLPDNRPSAAELSQMPLLQRSKDRVAEHAGVDAQLLDQMYAYSSFPLLKKAALVAMVSHADSDEDFGPRIEKFSSLDRHNTSGIDAEDMHKSLSEELLGDMRHLARQALARDHAMAGPRPVARRRRQQTSRKATEHFRQELRADVEQLIHKIDASGTGQISYSEWLAATAPPSWYTDPTRISAAFRLFDSDGDGMISENDLKKVIPDVFKKLTVDAVLQESQLSAKETSWISEEHFSLLLRTQNASCFTLRRIANGVEDPLATAEVAPGAQTATSAAV